MNAEEILIKLGLDATAMEQGLRKVNEKVGDWARDQMKLLSTMALGYVGIEGIKMAYEQTVEYADKIVDLSKRLGISTNAVQVWDYALRKNGSTIETAATFFEHLGQARDKAFQGGNEGEKLISEFHQLGISVDDLKNKRIEDLAEQISKIFEAGGDPQKLIGALRDIGGRGAGELIATLQEGLEKSRKEAEDLGLIIDHDTLETLKEAGDRATQLGIKLKAAFAPWLASIIEGMQYFFDLVDQRLAYWKAAFAAFKQHPTDLKAADEAGNKAQDDVFEKQNQRDKLAQQKRDREANANKGGGSDAARLEAEHEKAEQLNKQAAQEEAKANEKTLSLASQIAFLHLRRNRLQEEYGDKTKSELERAQARKDLADVELDLQGKLNEKKQKQQDLEKKIAGERDELANKSQSRIEQLRGGSYSTVEELAKNPLWFRGGPHGSMVQDQYSQAAQRIEFLEGRAKNERRRGFGGAADADMKEVDRLKGWLEKEGVVKPEQHLQNIDQGIAKLNKTVETDLAALKALGDDNP